MLETFGGFNPILQALIAGLFTWFCTIVGSSFVFLFKTVNRKVMDVMGGFAAGVMIAASFWSLLAPSISYAESNGYGIWSFVPAAVGFLLGGAFLRLTDAIIPHLHMGDPVEKREGPETKASRNLLLFLAITIHNIPEGLAVGVAFGAAGLSLAVDSTLVGAIALTLGIGLQNIPEGSALSMPIRADGNSRWRSFNIGQLSAIVEPVAAVIGAAAVLSMTAILPYALAFAAGAMIFVVVEELIPESQTNGNSDIATVGLMFGFTVMMILDVALG
ncbi:Zinc transporter ZupT [Jeotgalibaca dankookensis]|uniref:Zinc transporter ZupT n=1 Tax=Jeotgalibaca dankookensis TaxID=708126 RepID=A0A1S6IN99_9LACT|nr:ZIP family metal transporter [Jeotgalibaca dankookensis]AQS52981.1 Zinc transporter ZupT [Jeotgalibaca dankookensis]